METEEFASYSQARQDLFAWLCTGQKKDGTFVDLGAGDPERGSNTKALEQRGWRGILADIATWEELLKKRSQENVIFADALDPELQEEMKNLCDRGSAIDFLSLDLEPPLLTLQRLVTLPLHRVKFAVACVEHDSYRNANGSIRAAMRGIMLEHGYRMVASDVSMIGESDGRFGLVPVEDWWIHPTLVNEGRARQIADQIRAGSIIQDTERIGFLERAASHPEEPSDEG